MTRIDQQVRYVIRVYGRIDENLAGWSGPVSIDCAVADGDSAVTTLSGIVTDQAGLVGLIRHLHGLGIVLLSVERIDS